MKEENKQDENNNYCQPRSQDPNSGATGAPTGGYSCNGLEGGGVVVVVG